MDKTGNMDWVWQADLRVSFARCLQGAAQMLQVVEQAGATKPYRLRLCEQRCGFVVMARCLLLVSRLVGLCSFHPVFLS